MEFRFSEAVQMQIAVFTLVLFRIGGLFLMAPFFAGASIPQRLKVLLAAGIAICVAPLLGDQGPRALVALQEPLSAALTVISEIAIGAVVGFLLSVVVATVQTAGQLVAHDVGMTIANIIDPLSNRQISIVGQLLATLAIVIFLLLDLHHQLMRMVVESFRLLPIGSVAWKSVESLGAPLERVARVEGRFLFETATQLAVPVTIVLVLVTVAMGFLARAVPEINVFIIGFAVRIMVGFFVVVLMFPMLGRMYELMFRRVLRHGWDLLETIAGP